MSRSSERLSGTNLERVSLTLGDGNLLKDSRALGSEERGAGSGLEGGLLAEPDGNLQRYSLDDEPPTPLEVLGIYSHYACLGWLNGLAVGSVFAYCYYVKAQEANVCNALPGFIQLSWTFKFVYGAVQDAFPILGQHRVPYIIGGWVGTIALGLVIVLFEPSLSVFHYACVAAACEFCMIAADVACDGLVVGLSAREPAATRGTLLSNAYSVRFAAGTLANLTVAVLYNGRRDGGDFRFSLSLSQLWLIGVAPALAALVTTLPNIREPPAPPRRTLGATFGEFYAVLHKPGPWRVGLGFFLITSLSVVMNNAQVQGVVAWAGYTPLQAGVDNTLSYALITLTILGLKRYCLHVSWRKLYATGIVTMQVFALAFLLIVFVCPLRDGWFFIFIDLRAVGDEAEAPSLPQVLHLHRPRQPGRVRHHLLPQRRDGARARRARARGLDVRRVHDAHERGAERRGRDLDRAARRVGPQRRAARARRPRRAARHGAAPAARERHRPREPALPAAAARAEGRLRAAARRR